MLRLPSRYVPMLLFFVLLAIFPVVGKTLDDLRRSSLRLIHGAFDGSIAKVYLPRAGEERIPADALGAIRLLRENRLTEYMLSAGIKNTYAYQRIVEGAWPIRPAQIASFRLYLEQEPWPRNCLKKGGDSGIILVFCP